MKKHYIAPHVAVVELQHTSTLLTGSPTTMPLKKDSDWIEDSEDIH